MPMRAYQQLVARFVIIAVVLAPTTAGDLAGQSVNAAVADPVPLLGWQLTTDRSKAVDSPTAIVSVESSNVIEVGGAKIRPTLSVRCQDGKRDVTVYAGVPVQPYDGPGLQYEGSVIHYRRDEARPVDQVWSLSSDENSLGVRDDGLIVQLAMATFFQFEFTPLHASPVTAQFDVTGLSDHLEPLTRVCPSLNDEIAVATAASRKAPASNEATGVFFEFQVDRHVTLLPDNPVIPYPRMLRSANIEGEVLAQFIVDTTGHADMRTFKVLNTTHDLFTNSVKAALPSIRFMPAEIGNRKVRQVVQMPFQFNFTKSSP
jgi:hypothetical protein